jgi:hypothetical protein
VSNLFFTKLRVAPEIDCAPGWVAIVPDRGLPVAYQKDVVLWAVADDYLSSAQEVACQIVAAFNEKNGRDGRLR